ncbi:MAG: response regulator [Proteobacteria bacterium]|nr:response regulator [Pseudomonadota bacterium]MBU4470164.1 response regulator [Pseudomonadota bacterium]MCG2750471.1 response regulator [Desulfobacteraceae bacterium]
MEKHKILVVDDDALNVKLLAAMLPSDRYEKILAYGGMETLEKVESELPDLILLDVMMPDLDGYEIVEILKSDDRFRDIPIILVTALDGMENKIKAIECGADEFIKKPVHIKELLARVESLLKLRTYQNQLRTSSLNGTARSESHLYEKGQPVNLSLNLPFILIVEDDERDAKLIRSMLNGEPYQIKTVKTGEEAIESSYLGKIDVLLLDILLPGLDGFQVCRFLKEKGSTKNIQVVAMTNLMDLDSKIKGINFGLDEYLVKPINRYELKMRIKAMIKKKAYLDSLKMAKFQHASSFVEDPETGLCTQEYFQHFFDLETRRCNRQNTSMCFLSIEIPRENLSHPSSAPSSKTGSRIVDDVIKNNIRDVDFAAYFHPGRFAVLLINSNMEGAKKVGERIKRGIENLDGPGKVVEGSLVVDFDAAVFPGEPGKMAELSKKTFNQNS